MQPAVDLNQYLTFGGLSALLTLLIAFVKTYVVQDRPNLLPYLAVGAGVILAPLFAIVTGHVAAPADAVSYLMLGLLAGLASIGIHETTINQINPPAHPASGTPNTTSQLYQPPPTHFDPPLPVNNPQTGSSNPPVILVDGHATPPVPFPTDPVPKV
jgi:hypothetical protein